jgi:hypothetical protein
VDPEAKYQITRFDQPGQTEISGKELLEKGLPVSMPERPGAAVVKYQRVP